MPEAPPRCLVGQGRPARHRDGVALALGLLAVLAPSAAWSQATEPCRGESWGELAGRRYGRPELGRLVAAFNGSGSPACPAGQFVRLPAVVGHPARLGQTMAALARQYLRAAGAEAFLREINALPAGEPTPGMLLRIPAELELAVGSRPEAEIEALPGAPPLAVVRRYNGLGPAEPLPGGGTIYLPLLLEPLTRTTPEHSAGTSTAVQPSWPGGQASSAPASPASFSHARHRARIQPAGCELCHAPRTDPRVPAPAKREACLACHPRVEEAGERQERLALLFPHGVHLAEGGKLPGGGYQLGCASCHPGSDADRRGRPGHGQCDRCHNPSEVRPAVEGDCEGCHDRAESERMPGLLAVSPGFRRSSRGHDVRFEHPAHRSPERSGDEACLACHPRARAAAAREQVGAPSMVQCLECHRGLAVRSEQELLALDRCASCHLTFDLAERPARSNTPQRALVHSRAFRRGHGRAAELDGGTCAACHPELAGGRGERCAGCHQSRPPADHGPRWRDVLHGRGAEREPERCAVCHARDRCADCHALAPRDHTPLARFTLRHEVQARRSIRRCRACHEPAVDCARCHDVAR